VGSTPFHSSTFSNGFRHFFRKIFGMKILFVCGQGRHRSRTAAELFKDTHETKYAGIFSEDNPVTLAQIEWADLIVVMEDEHRIMLGRKFPAGYLKKRIVSLGISDAYAYNDAELKDILKRKMKDIL
jgi:predicted protein tyrosine phosphatase